MIKKKSKKEPLTGRQVADELNQEFKKEGKLAEPSRDGILVGFFGKSPSQKK